MNAVHIFILSAFIENEKKHKKTPTSVDVMSIVVTQEGFEPPTL